MLARVLLDMVQPARPVNSPAHGLTASWRRTLDHVQHALIPIIDTLNNAYAVERAGITRLAAPSRVKRCAIEDYCGPTTHAIAKIDDASFKLDQMGIGIIETFGY